MVHDDPMGIHFDTKYRDPTVVAQLGANGMVPAYNVQCAVELDEFDPDLFADHPEELSWIRSHRDQIAARLAVLDSAGMPAYPFTDFAVFPRFLLENHREEIVKDSLLAGADEQSEIYTAIRGQLAPDIKKPLADRLIRIQIREIFRRFPSLAGLTVRFGETYTFLAPHHAGGSPVARGGAEGIGDHVRFLNLLREEICERLGKTVIYRTWDFGFFHEDPDVFAAIVEQVEPHAKLVFSIKHQKEDFHRMTPFNPTLGVGRHPYIVEVCCQLDSYGKGAHPYYIGDGVINGYEEFEFIMPKDVPHGLADIRDDAGMSGVMTWSRGGGWLGPYISNELWIDLNTCILSWWAQDSSATEEELFARFMRERGILGNDARLFRRIALLSAAGSLRGHCTFYEMDSLDVWWTRDHFFGGLPILRAHFERLIELGLVEQSIAEKEEAVSIWEQIEALSRQMVWDRGDELNHLRVSCTYGRLKYEVLAAGWTVMLLGLQGDLSGSPDRSRIHEALVRYDRAFADWAELKEHNRSCATIYEPHAFDIDFSGAFADPTRGMQASVDTYREEE
jgi:hypothetical protein